MILSRTIFLSLLGFVFFFPQGARAISPHLMIAPEKFEWEVERGESFKESINILNRGEDPIPLGANVFNFTAEDYTGTIQFYGQTLETMEKGIDDAPFNPSRWVRIENPNFILDPGEEAEIRFSVQIPENAEPGGHYAVIIFEPKLPSFYFEEGAQRVLLEAGVLLVFSVEVEGTERAAEPFRISALRLPEEERMRTLENGIEGAMSKISELILRRAFARAELLQIVESSPIHIVLGVKNDDVVHVRPRGLVSIYNFRDKKVDEVEIKPQTVLPDKIREFYIPFRAGAEGRNGEDSHPKLALGRYSAMIELQGVGGFTLSERFSFWVFPWKRILVIIVVGATIAIAAFRLRRRIRLALSVFISPGKALLNLRKPK